MVLDSTRKAAASLTDPHARGIVLKALGLTVLLFLAIWLGLQNLVSVWLLPFLEGWTWLSAAILWLLGAGIIVTGAFLLGPVTAVFAGIFLDDVAEHVERQSYPDHRVGKAMALVPGVLMAVQFAAFVLFMNLVALMLVWLAGFGVIIFFVVNGYLLGREYFLFAAMRFKNTRDAKAVAKRYSLEVFLAGLLIAGFMSVPLLNLLTPVFAASLMVHLHKAIDLRLPE